MIPYDFPFSSVRWPDKYLIDECSIAYCSSFQNFISYKSRKKKKFENALFIGGVDYGINLNYSNIAGIFGKLESSSLEVRNINETLEPYKANSFKATVKEGAVTETFIKDSIAGFELVHLSTHGFLTYKIKSYYDLLDRHRHAFPPLCTLGEINPYANSGLIFSYGNHRSETTDFWAETTKNNGILTSQEILFLNLKGNQLLFLSACNTAMGLAYSGEGLQGVLNSFQNAGSKQTMATIFAVEDRGTNKFMSLFYEKLAANPIADLDLILTETISNIRKYKVGDEMKFSDPKYWVPFVIYLN